MRISWRSWDSQKIQRSSKCILRKFFAGIFDVEFRNSGVNMQIVSMIGCTGETVSLVSPVMVDGNLESWLKSLQKGMVTTLQESLKNCIKEKQLSISQYPGEILGITKEVEFKSKVTDAIEKRKLEEVLEQMNQFLDNLTSARPKLNKIDQIKVKNLIMDIIHQISVLELLVQTQTHNINNWHWFKQLKFSCGTSGN
jgi:dynein heavy chain 2